MRESVKIVLAVGSIVALSAWQVFGSNRKKAGHDLASNEKPQVLRNESERTLEGEKAKAAASRAAKAAKALEASGSATAR